MSAQNLKELSEHGAIGVVIPGYGHPKFLVEAVNSACSQVCSNDIHVVIVDDGCLYPETAETAQALMATYPETLSYLRQPNTRLPGARNAGIKFLLECSPAIEAIFFLDADNRLQKHSLEAYYKTLREKQGIAWAYPDINFFGMTWGSQGFDTRITSANYSVLKHLIGNISEAGSLVHADIFRQGFLYDESMKNGFEDWEFWLQLLSAGYRGIRAENAGFMYRRRSESMLTDSRRTEEHIISGMRRKHAGLYSTRNVMALEHEEAPAFAVFLTDCEEVLMFSDPLLPHQTLSLQTFLDLRDQWIVNPHADFFPVKILAMSQECWSVLRKVPHWLRWFFWKVRESKSLHFRISFNAKPLPEFVFRRTKDTNTEVSVISSLLLQKEYLTEEPKYFQVCLPGLETDHRPAMGSFESLFARSATSVPSRRHLQKRFAGPSSIGIRKIIAEELTAEEQRQPFCVGHNDGRLIIGSETLDFSQYSYLSQYRRRLLDVAIAAGFEAAALFELFPTKIRNDIDGDFYRFSDRVSDIVPLVANRFKSDMRMYLGRQFRNRLTPDSREDGSLIVRTCNWLVAIGAGGSVELMGEARAYGARTSVILHADQNSPLSDDDFTRVLAYEHVINDIACDDAGIKSLLSASGVPPQKIISTQSLYDAIAVGIR